MIRLSRIRDDIESELEELTASLFQVRLEQKYFYTTILVKPLHFNAAPDHCPTVYSKKFFVNFFNVNFNPASVTSCSFNFT